MPPIIKLLKDLIGFFQVKIFGVEVFDPVDDFLVLGMIGVVEGIQKLGVAWRATTIFGWAIALATEAFGAFGFVAYDFFHGQQMLPVVAKIINIAEGITLF